MGPRSICREIELLRTCRVMERSPSVLPWSCRRHVGAATSWTCAYQPVRCSFPVLGRAQGWLPASHVWRIETPGCEICVFLVGPGKEGEQGAKEGTLPSVLSVQGSPLSMLSVTIPGPLLLLW